MIKLNTDAALMNNVRSLAIMVINNSGVLARTRKIQALDSFVVEAVAIPWTIQLAEDHKFQNYH